MFCMIGGAGSFPANMARRKSIPAIEAITSVGVTPYSTWRGGLSVMESDSCDLLYNDGRHTKYWSYRQHKIEIVSRTRRCASSAVRRRAGTRSEEHTSELQ